MPPLLNSSNATATNLTAISPLQVVCAWPVSGQYGPGSRFLYYILIAACVFARKAEWLRNACLAAALLFPAVAALHGIVLASLHVDDAVDMDIYGAFQLCTIGILAAPVTVRLSKTYFDAPGRNIIFLWTSFILSGLLSLVVEFYRTKTKPCNVDDSGNPVYWTTGNFSYATQCGLICMPDQDGSPVSPLRRAAQNNIYVIPAPIKLTFGTATLIAAACCVPAVIYMGYMWIKILENNWNIQFGNKAPSDQPIEGTNGATVEKMKDINSWVSRFLSVVEYPLFGAAVLAIIIFGEWNFFSRPVYYQTEPLASVGQWAPMVGTALAVFGSLYLLVAKRLENETIEAVPGHHCCTCSSHEPHMRPTSDSSGSIAVPSAHHPEGVDLQHYMTATEVRPSTEMRSSSDSVPRATLVQTMSQRSRTTDAGNRRKVAETLSRIGNYLGSAAPDRFDDSDFKHGKAVDFPEIPGEEHRNDMLPKIREQFNTYDGTTHPVLREQRSRAGSFNSRLNVEVLPTAARSPSPRRSTLDVHPPRSPTPTTPSPRRSTLEVQTNPMRSPSPRRDTLEVPPLGQHSPGIYTPGHYRSSSGGISPTSPTSPTVVVSHEDQADSRFVQVFESPPTTPPPNS